jgi:hypothetical protein
MLAGLTQGPAWWLPGLAALDADAGTAALALTADQPAAHASPPARWAVVATDSAASSSAVAEPVWAFPGEPNTIASSGAGGTTGFPAFRQGIENPLALPLTTDLLQGLTSLPDPGHFFPALLVRPGWGLEAGNAAGVSPEGGGRLIAPAPSIASGFGTATPAITAEGTSVTGPRPSATRTSSALPGTTTPSPTQVAQIRQAYGQLPLRFEANVGQTNARVQFLAQGAGYNLFLTGTDAVLALQAPASTPAPDHLGTPAALPAPRPSAVLRMQILSH